MSYAQSNNMQSFSKVVDTTLSSYTLKDTTAILPNESQSQILTLHVLSARNNLVVLQEPSTGKRINIDKQSIDGTNEAFLAKGDKLVLVNHNDKLSSFRLEQVSASNKLVNLKSFSPILSAHWPDIPPSAFKTNLPVVLNQLQLMNNSVQSKLLSSAIIEIAHKTGQSMLSLSADANVSFTGYADTIDVAASSATGIRFTIDLSATHPFEINIPVLTELTDKLTNGSTIKIEFNADRIKHPISNITVNNQGILGDTISAASIRAINNSLNTNATQLTPLLNTLLAEPQSNSLKTGIVIIPTAQNLATLGNSISRPILQNGTCVAQAKLHETRILVTQSNTSNPHIHLTLLAKPVIMSIDNIQLGALSSKLFRAESINNATLLTSTAVAKSEFMANSKIFQLNEHKVTSAPHNSTGGIKEKNTNMLVE